MLPEVKAVVFLPLSQGKVAVIDFEDFEKVRGMKWHAQKDKRTFYARRAVPTDGKQTITSLHRVITDCPPDMEVHHINGDGLDNRRENLQICTHQQNLHAHCRKQSDVSSGYRGVGWYKPYKCWRARITLNYQALHLGYFDAEEAAARAYDKKAIELFGVHAAPNFPV